MSQPPRYPAPPPSYPTPPPEPPPLQQEAWQDYQPGHYVHVHKRTHPALKLGAAAVVIGGLAAGLMLIATRVGTGDIYGAVEAKLAEARCAGLSGQTPLHLLIADARVDVFLPEAPVASSGCITHALSGLELSTGTPEQLLTVQLVVDIGDDGKVTVAPHPRETQRLDIEWVVGVLGEETSSERGTIHDLVDAALPQAVECYADAWARESRRVYSLSWHTEEQVSLRVRMNPDGSLGNIIVGRPGTGEKAIDWTRSQTYQDCTRHLLQTMAWPGHDGTTQEWVNTMFTVTATQL